MKAGWEVKMLGEIADIQSGSGFPEKYQGILNHSIPFYKVSDMNLVGNEREMIFENNTISESVRTQLGASIFPKGSTIFPKIGGAIFTNKKRITSKNSCVDNNVMGAIPKKNKIDSQFLYYFFQSHDLVEFANDAHLPSIRKTVVETWPIKIPLSITEQQRIVAILDQAFEGIAKARANAQQNLQNARALFESHLQSVFSVRPELVEGRGESWINAALGKYIKFIDYRGKTPEKTEDGLRLITAKNVKMGYLQDNPREYVAPKTYDSWMTRGVPRLGDVLFTTEAPLANVAQLDTDEKVVFAQRIIIMQPDTSKLDSTFLKYMLLSEPIQKRIHDKGTGATVKGIKASLLKNIQISFPNSVSAQAKIVDKFDALSAETKRLETLYQRKIALLDELKKSLLQQAFAGEL
jgi:type I restriction enzyme, S subunit